MHRAGTFFFPELTGSPLTPAGVFPLPSGFFRIAWAPPQMFPVAGLTPKDVPLVYKLELMELPKSVGAHPSAEALERHISAVRPCPLPTGSPQLPCRTALALPAAEPLGGRLRGTRAGR